MTNHTEVLNYIIEKKGYTSYLEIGTQAGKNFNAIKCERKTGVDPDPDAKATHHLDSDTFFESTGQQYDLIFIDGLHTAEQVKKDFENAMACLNDDGVIVLHDTNPEKEEWTQIPRVTKQWTGDVYLFVCSLVAEFKTLPFDYGITVVKKSEYTYLTRRFDWDYFNKYNDELLGIVSLEEFKTWL